jgi:hypothetical protein
MFILSLYGANITLSEAPSNYSLPRCNMQVCLNMSKTTLAAGMITLMSCPCRIFKVLADLSYIIGLVL